MHGYEAYKLGIVRKKVGQQCPPSNVPKFQVESRGQGVPSRGTVLGVNIESGFVADKLNVLREARREFCSLVQ